MFMKACVYLNVAIPKYFGVTLSAKQVIVIATVLALYAASHKCKSIAE